MRFILLPAEPRQTTLPLQDTFCNPRKGKHIITTKIEHPSVLEVFNNLSQHGYKVDFIDVDKNGIVIVDDLRKK